MALVAVVGVMGMTFACGAQVASAILRTNDPLGGSTVSAINNTGVNHVGGYALTVNTADGLSRVWGNLSGGAPPPGGAIIRREGEFDGIMQTSYEAFFGIGSTNVTYSPIGNGGGFTGLDCVFRDDTRIMAERDPHPSLAGQFWSFGSRPSITSDGQVWFVGGITSTAGGTTQNRGLFTGGNSTSVVLLGGQMVSGLDSPLNTGTTVDFDFRVSGSGQHYIAPVVLSTGSTANDGAVVFDGAGLTAGNSLVREGTVVPVSVGGDGIETYQNFDFMGVTDAGSWMVTGDTNAATTADEYVMVNGMMVLRDGAVIGSDTVQGDIEGGYLNNDGDWAVVWDVSNNTIEALIVNGQIVLREGDTVDWTGDGVAEVDSLLTDFTGISALTLSDRAGGAVQAYFTANVNVGGTVIEGALRLSVGIGPACPCDFNNDNALNSQDYFDFLSCFFGGGCPPGQDADFNDDNTVNSQDYFDFLSCFFGGC
jgi:hypothetical protein